MVHRTRAAGPRIAISVRIACRSPRADGGGRGANASGGTKPARCDANIIVETGSARDPHHFAVLLGFGANAHRSVPPKRKRWGPTTNFAIAKTTVP